MDGWLFLSADIRFLSLGRFWGDEAAKVSRARKPEAADPIAAIVDFHQQLKQLGIELLLLPVPSKAAVYPEKIVPMSIFADKARRHFLRVFTRNLRPQESTFSISRLS